MADGDLSADWSQVASFVSSVDASLGNWLDETYGVGLTEYRSLTLLSAAPDKELRVSTLAQRVGLSQSSATRLVGRLEAKELSRRDLCPDDGRGVYAVITEKGEALVARVRNAYKARIGELLASTGAHEVGPDTRRLGHALHCIADRISL